MSKNFYIENERRISNLYEVLKSYAPNPSAIEACQHFTNKSQTTQQEIILELTSAIYDGLAYGNWPWMIHNAIPKEK